MPKSQIRPGSVWTRSEVGVDSLSFRSTLASSTAI